MFVVHFSYSNLFRTARKVNLPKFINSASIFHNDACYLLIGDFFNNLPLLQKSLWLNVLKWVPFIRESSKVKTQCLWTLNDFELGFPPNNRFFNSAQVPWIKIIHLWKCLRRVHFCGSFSSSGKFTLAILLWIFWHPWSILFSSKSFVLKCFDIRALSEPILAIPLLCIITTSKSSCQICSLKF